MLHRKGKRGLEPWSTGAAIFRVAPEDSGWRMLVAVHCRLGGQKRVLALLDTAAEWSVVDGDTARLLRDHLEDLELPITMMTRHGPFTGTLHRIDVELLADPTSGSDLMLDATVLVLPGWPGPVVLGFRGLLESVRFALDPDDQGPTFYFGPR